MEAEWNTTVHKQTEGRNTSPNNSSFGLNKFEQSDGNKSTPLWIDDVSILHKKIQETLYEVMKKYLTKKYSPDMSLEPINAIVEKLSQKEEWVAAFTHESVNADVNNSCFLYEGSELINFIFARYLVTRFGTIMNAHKCTTLTQHYMSNINLINIAAVMDIGPYVHHNTGGNAKDRVVILKSFFACLHHVGETYTDLSGYQWCLVMMKWLFDDVEFDVNMNVNYKTQLKEIYDKRGWKHPKFWCVQVQDGNDMFSSSLWLVRIMSGKRVMGTGKAILKVDATSIAAKETLTTLENDDKLREQQIVHQNHQVQQTHQNQQKQNQQNQQNHQNKHNQQPIHKNTQKRQEKSTEWQKTKENVSCKAGNIRDVLVQNGTGIVNTNNSNPLQNNSPLSLYVIKRNNYGNPQLSETLPLFSGLVICADQIPISSLKSNEYWSIKEPSDSIRNIVDELHPKSSIYQCNGINFLISPVASQFYKPENSGYGSGIVIEFIDKNAEKWFLLISDDKHYIANVQGCSEGKETYEECIKREVFEETAIDLKNITPIPIARYGFVYKNALVDCEYEVKSEMFFVQLPYSKVSHLFPNGLKSNQINIVDVNTLPFLLDEVKYIIAIPASMNMDSVPEKFEEIQISKNIKGNLTQVPVEYPKKSHHRQFIDLFKTNEPIVKPPYLNTLTFDVRYKEALDKFNDVNGEKKLDRSVRSDRSELWFFFRRLFELTPIRCEPTIAVRHGNIHTLVFDYPNGPYKLTLNVDSNLINQDKLPFSYTVDEGLSKTETHGDLMKSGDKELLLSYLLKL
jgi:dsRNA-specific ribonuclease/8-oxo-dGTP pyrophosphatase MutT (NUDIX family)